jgi:hypothetical protein
VAFIYPSVVFGGGSKTIVVQRLRGPWQFLRPTNGSIGRLPAADRTPSDLTIAAAQKEFQFSGPSTPPRWLIGRPQDRCADRIRVGHPGTTKFVRSTTQHFTAILHRERQPPDGAAGV